MQFYLVAILFMITTPYRKCPSSIAVLWAWILPDTLSLMAHCP